MLDLDELHKEYPPHARLGIFQQDKDLTWHCSLVPIDSGRGAWPSYASGKGPTPSIAFARAKVDWLDCAKRRGEATIRPEPKRYERIDITLEDLEL